MEQPSTRLRKDLVKKCEPSLDLQIKILRYKVFYWLNCILRCYEYRHIIQEQCHVFDIQNVSSNIR